MKLITTDIEGVVILEPELHEDSRGYFFESFHREQFRAATGLDIDFVQENESCSQRGVVRGMHFQLPPFAQSKLVRVVRGEILDVALDIRRGSPTFGRSVAVRLGEDNHQQLFIPRGFAHGFTVLRGDAIVQYKVDNYYAPQCEGSILWCDPTLDIAWNIDKMEAVVSAKDAAAPKIAECKALFDYSVNYYA